MSIEGYVGLIGGERGKGQQGMSRGGAVVLVNQFWQSRRVPRKRCGEWSK